MDWASIKSGADIWTSIDCHAGIGADMDIMKNARSKECADNTLILG